MLSRSNFYGVTRSSSPRTRVSPFAVPQTQSAFHSARTINHCPSRCPFCSRCWLSSRKDMIDNKPHAGDDNSPDCDDFCQNSRIFGRSCPAAVVMLAGRFRFPPMKPLLNVLREFGEIHLRNSRFSSKLNPIRFYAAHCYVFVYLPAEGFEVLSKRECR